MLSSITVARKRPWALQVESSLVTKSGRGLDLALVWEPLGVWLGDGGQRDRNTPVGLLQSPPGKPTCSHREISSVPCASSLPWLHGNSTQRGKSQESFPGPGKTQGLVRDAAPGPGSCGPCDSHTRSENRKIQASAPRVGATGLDPGALGHVGGGILSSLPVRTPLCSTSTLPAGPCLLVATWWSSRAQQNPAP